MSVTVRVPATSANLGAGYDCLGVALARHVRVTATEGAPEAGVRVRTTGHGADRLATGDDNLVWTSLVAFCAHHDVDVPEVTLDVHNDIPLARGLGSSSSAIVAGLVMGRALTEVPVGTPDLVALATRMEGHPDNVAPALLGGFVAGGVADDGTTVVRRAQPAPSLTIVAAVPAFEQLTSEARAMVPDHLERRDVITQVGRAAHVTGALLGGWPPDVRLCGDVLHEPARLERMPVTAAILSAWRAAGIFGWLSGAGPSATALVAASPDDVACAKDLAATAMAEFDVVPTGDAATGAHEVVELPWDLAGATVLPD